KGDQSKRVISIFAMGEVNWVTTPYTHLNTTAKMASGNNTTKPPTNDFFTKRVGLSPSCAISDTPQLLHTQLQLFQTLARHSASTCLPSNARANGASTLIQPFFASVSSGPTMRKRCSSAVAMLYNVTQAAKYTLLGSCGGLSTTTMSSKRRDKKRIRRSISRN